MPNLEVPVPYEIDEQDLKLIRLSRITRIKSLFIKKEIPGSLKEEEQDIIQVKPIKPEPLNYIDILEERKERTIKKDDFSTPELEKSEKEILNKLARL